MTARPRIVRARIVPARTVALVAVLAATGLGCPGRAPQSPAEAPLSEAATLDSLRAAAAAGRPDRTLLWAERRRGFAPHEPLHMIGHAVALHDFAWTGASSLRRVETEIQAMAILDSAGRATTDLHVRGLVAQLLGTQFENWGLRLDALTIYSRALGAAPNDTAFAARITHVIGVLRDPRAMASGKNRAARGAAP